MQSTEHLQTRYYCQDLEYFKKHIQYLHPKNDELAKSGVKRNPSVPKRAVVIWIYTEPSGRLTSHKNSRYFVNPQLICPRSYLMKIVVKANENL